MNKFKVLLIVSLIAIVGLSACTKAKTQENTFRPVSTAESGEHRKDMSKNDTEDETVSDIEAYYQENSKILSITNAQDSTTVQTEREINKDFTDRGFTQNPIISDYSMTGEVNKIEISDTDEVHPTYYTSYTSSNGTVWTILSQNGNIMANAILTDSESNSPTQIMVSEKESIVCYDSFSNQFFEVIPFEDVLVIKVVDKIDAQTLDSLSDSATE